MKRTLVQLGLVAAIISTLAGCGGGGGSDGAPGASTTTTTVVTAPSSGTPAPVSLDNSATPTATQLTAWANMAPQATFAGGQVQSPPQIKFVLTDQDGKAIFDLRKNKTTPAAPALPFYQDMYFTFAKFVPAANGSPSKWVNMNMFKAPTAAQAAGTLGVSDLCVSAANSPDGKGWCATYPNYDREGTITYDGTTYTYTFFRDFKKSAAIAAAMTGKSGLKDASGLPMSDDGTAKVADMGDLSWNPSGTYRIAFMFYGNAPGTSTNTPDGSTSATAPTGVSTSVNSSGMFTYDFTVDSSGNMVAAANPRDIVNIDSCADCHDGKGIGHSSRRDPKVCVTCHTDQVKTTFNGGEATRAADGITLTGATSNTQAVLGGRAVGNYPNMVHKIHMGTNLTLQGYFYNSNAIGNFNKYELPMDPNNCTKCHSGQAPSSPLNAVQTTHGDNWKNAPSRLACGSCHDGIDFATGLGITEGGATTGHGAGLPGPQADDSKCVTCHSADRIALKHGTPVTTPNNPNLSAMGTTTAGSVATITYDLNSVSVVNGNAVLKFRILKNGSPVTLNTPTLVRNANNGQMVVDPNYEPITGFAGGPSLYVAFGVPQDGITSPLDFNKSYSTALANVLIPSGSPKAGSVTAGPDGSGYYTVTLTGDLVGQPSSSSCAGVVPPTLATCITSNTTPSGLTNGSTTGGVLPAPFLIPASAKLVTGAMIGTFTQKVATGYTTYVATGVTKNNVAVGPASTLGSVAKGNVAAYGGVVIKSMLAKKVATGSTARRVLVDAANCNRCHEQLGARAENTVNNVGLPNAVGAGDFHGGARNDPTACALCHNVTQTSGGWTSNASTFVHGIHAGYGTTGNSSAGRNKRTNKYTWHATSATVGFWTDVIYPGVLADCNQCHAANVVNLAPVGAAGVTNLLWPTTATGTITTGTTTSPYIVSGTNYGNGFSFVGEGATLSSFTTKSGVTLYKGDGTTVVATYAAGAVVPATVAPAGGLIVPADAASLVSSPVSSACFSCHDTTTASAHMTQYGGYINTARGTVGSTNMKANPETCYVCHGPSKTADVAIVHHK